jgi:hypothetical protein
VTRSVEIPDRAIAEVAGRMFDGELTRQPQQVQDRVWRDARAALVAARPYLMPSREEIAEAMHNHWWQTHLWRQGCRQDLCIDVFLDRASAVLTLLNGVES